MSCVNRTSQHGLKYRLEVFRTAKKGWAVRSWDTIPSGAPVCEYTGILSRTYEIETDLKNNYIFDIDCLQTMKGLDGREEKHRERKHKKEKDKERGESKERKDKDRSNAKHKDKKEKHRDTKDRDRDRDREKDKKKSSEDQRTKHVSEVHHEDRLGYDSRKAEESTGSKFTEDFGRRTRDDEKGAATRMVEDLSATAHRRVQSMGASSDVGKESVTGNKMVTGVTSTVQRRNEKLISLFQKGTEGMGPAITMEKQKVSSSEKAPDFNSAERRKNKNFIHSTQKRIESMGAATAMEKQRAASNDKLGAFSFAEQRRNHATGRLMDNIPSSVQRRTEGKFTVDSMQKERVASNNMVSNSTGAAEKRNDGLERPTESWSLESLTSSVSRKIENIGAAPAMEKERSLFLNVTGTEQRTDAMGPSVEKDAGKKTQGKEKTKEKKTKDGKREGHKDRDRKGKKRKEKHKDRPKEKKKEEKMKEKGEHKHTKHDKLRESVVTDRIDNLISNTLAPCIEDTSTAGVDGNTKKRKEFESNGFLHEPQDDVRPNKLPRSSAVSSHSPVENGRPLEFVHNALPCDSAKLGVVNNTKIERDLDDNGNHPNGMMVVQSKHTLKPPVAPIVPHALVDSSMSDQLPLKPPPPNKSDIVPVKPPHLDTKYLSTIYSVPKAGELLESDDQEWLFSSENPRSNTNLEVDGTPPQVWATGLQIESADVFALPYVIPF